MTIQNETVKFVDSRLSHPKPQPPPRSHTCLRNYEEAKAALLACVAEPRLRIANPTQDQYAWNARQAEFRDAKERFDRVYSDLDPLDTITIIADYRETLREASKRLDATIEPPPNRYIKIDDGIDRTMYVYYADPVHGDLLLGKIEEPDDWGRFRTVAADETNLGLFNDQQSALAALRAYAGR